MAEEEKDPEGEKQEVEKKKLSKKQILLIVSAGLLFLIVAVGAPTAYFMLSGKSSEIEQLRADILQAEEDNVVQEGWNEEDEYDEDEEPLGAIYPLSTFVVNLAEEGSYLRAQIQLEFTGQNVPNRFLVRQVPLRDEMIKILASRRPNEIVSADGRQELKDLIKEKINSELKREVVKEVYFTQFVMQ